MEGLFECSANYVPLSPISFLERATFVYGGSLSTIYGDTRYTWRETHDRCYKLASGLSQLEISHGDVVAAMAPNIPALYELHFAVPMAGAVLSALNTRLDAPTLATILQELEAKAIFVDYQSTEVVLKSFDILTQAKINPPRLVLITEQDQSISLTAIEVSQRSLNYNELLAMGKPDFKIVRPSDERDPISVSYTSGSTGRPKGVIYSHRAVYLNSLAVIFRSEMRKKPVFLWTVDMFRCNGWCFAWAMAALGGTNICIREVTAKVIFDSIAFHKVTHLFGAPAILNKIAHDSPSSNHLPLRNKVEILVAGVLPSPHILKKVEILGFKVNLGYGMTEALGPMMVRPLKPEIGSSSMDDCCEGVHNILMEEVDVKNPESMASVLPDGKCIGEVMIRGNVLMSGYLKNMERAKSAFRGGWYRTGDLGVRHPNGYIEMMDRVLDRVVCGGETISTMAVEAVLVSHPMITEAAVVGRPDEVFGEIPCAFVKLKEGCCLRSEEIIKFCKEKLPCHMTLNTVVFGDLPVNSTGKIQKFILREKSKVMGMQPHQNEWELINTYISNSHRPLPINISN